MTRLDDVREMASRAPADPLWDQLIAAMREAAIALDELDRLEPQWWRPWRLPRAHRLVRRAERACLHMRTVQYALGFRRPPP